MHKSSSTAKYRPDIDGLRAIAIFSVVIFHAFPTILQGGYVGVDIFFVISGYLISIILFSSIENGSISFLEFYIRRVRRIFPALSLVLFSSLIFGWFSLLPEEYKQLGKHVAGGATFLSNFVLWRESGYFDEDAATKPLLNLLSLGIEEQFYIIWPFLLYASYKLRLNLLIVCIALAIFSFQLNISTIQVDATADFYSPFTRFWELMAGSALAWLMHHKATYLLHISSNLKIYLVGLFKVVDIQKLRVLINNFLAFFGFTLLIYGFLLFNKSIGSQGAWTLIPVTATLLLIYAGPMSWINRTLFSNKLAVFFGLISYPLYLWHWPILSFATILEGSVPSIEIRLIAVFISTILAWLTFRFIEKPIRVKNHGVIGVTALLMSMVFLCGCGLFIYKKDGLPNRNTLNNITLSTQAFGIEDEQSSHDSCIKLLGLKQWIRYCSVSIEKVPSVAIIGDSHAAALYKALAEELKLYELGLLNIGGRLFLDVATTPRAPDPYEIAVYKGGIVATEFAANSKTIETVIMVSRGPLYLLDEWNLNLISDPTVVDKFKVWKVGMRRTLDKFIGVKKKIIFVIDNPELNFDPRSCQRPFRINKTDVECVVSREEFDKRNKQYRELVFSILKDYPSVTLFDAAAYLCDDKYCYARKDEKILYGDSNHLSYDGASLISKELVEVIMGGDSKILQSL